QQLQQPRTAFVGIRGLDRGLFSRPRLIGFVHRLLLGGKAKRAIVVTSTLDDYWWIDELAPAAWSSRRRDFQQRRLEDACRWYIVPLWDGTGSSPASDGEKSMSIRAAPDVTRQLLLVSRSCAIFVAMVGAAVLAGWALDLPAVKGLGPGWATMKANTAACFLLTGLALGSSHIHSGSESARLLARYVQ